MLEMKEAGLLTNDARNARHWGEWPCCPDCGHRRQTVCPVCGAAGHEFLLAEYLAPVEPLRQSRGGPGGAWAGNETALEILLMCPQCDEAFAPQFYRRCPVCGHDAGTGLEVRSVQGEPLSDRLLLAINGLMLVILLLVLYFWLLFRR